jgi:predicted transcriptional regulator
MSSNKEPVMSTKSLPKMVCELLATGYSYKELAILAGCDTSTISRIKTGFIADPRFSVGTAITRLYTDRILQAA